MRAGSRNVRSVYPRLERLPAVLLWQMPADGGGDPQLGFRKSVDPVIDMIQCCNDEKSYLLMFSALAMYSR